MITPNLEFLFPTPIVTYQRPHPVTRQELDQALEEPIVQNNPQAVRQTVNTRVLDQPGFESIREFCQASIDSYFEEIYRPSPGSRLKITQSWINITEPNEYHHTHAHPNSFISGVFYFAADPAQDRIEFVRPGYQAIKVIPREITPFNADTWWYPVKPNQLIVFPSSAVHRVPTRSADAQGSRISLSFNTFPEGLIGDPIGLSELITQVM